eukprot:TRINITY_DN9602_c0_g1_i1.p1 TRINITY_DN9602_c0_g1~~TRINITY_DN9602_c0_g1_i1.p1  ORF type:complete len:491 (+),score=134.35 TRINITY_DN9602_c0_g1_i1:184-1656(+)
MESSMIVRPLGNMEKYSFWRHRLGFYYGVAVCARLRLGGALLDDGAVLVRALERAALETMNVVPNLCAVVDGSGPEPAFVGLRLDAAKFKVPLRQARRENDQTLLREFEKEVNAPYDLDNHAQPLWRLVLIGPDAAGSADLVFAFHHCIVDGRGGMSILTTLLEKLRDVLQDRVTASSPFAFRSDSTAGFGPSLETACSAIAPSIGFLLRKLAEKLLLPSFVNNYLWPKTFWHGFKDVSADEIEAITANPTSYPTQMSMFELTAKELSALLALCRQHGTTVHGALCAALCIGISRVAREAGQLPSDGDTLEFGISCAVDLRPVCTPPLDRSSAGVYVSGASLHHYARPSGEFWPLAIGIKRSLVAEQRRAQQTVGLLKYLTDWPAFFLNERRSSPGGRAYSMDVSNLGSHDGFESRGVRRIETPTGSVEVLSGAFTQSANLAAGTFLVSAVTVRDVCTVVLSYRTDTVSQASASAVADATRAVLLSVVRQ